MSDFKYIDERFADLQMLRYRLHGWEELTLDQKIFAYYLAKATIAGRDITFDQFGKYNLAIRNLLEDIYVAEKERENDEFKALAVYLKRVWFSSGIYHHYGCEKFKPEFSEKYLRDEAKKIDYQGDIDELVKVIFDADYLPKRVDMADGKDVVLSSACNYYEGVNQAEVEAFYKAKNTSSDNQPSWGLNSKLVKENGEIRELVYKEEGLYDKQIKEIVHWLEKAKPYAENEQQKKVISLLIDYYKTGDLKLFDDYSIEWLKEQDARIDFINGFIEVYGDPLGLKGSWEGLVEYKDVVATRRTELISNNAQWFEDHSPVDPRFRKPKVKGVSAKVICAAMLGGDEYPASAIGINLPNADWIRAEYGSKSVTIGNLTDAYNKAAHGNGFMQEFVWGDETMQLVEKYADVCDDLHTDLHECLGHGSGQLLPGTDPNALKAYGNTIEEARADLFGLYYIADRKLVELGLTPNDEAYKSQYYTYMMNGALTQCVRIDLGKDIEEAHMRNRALIANWVLDNAEVEKGGTVCRVAEIVEHAGKHYIQINDYQLLRDLFAKLLAEIQCIKSEGDFEAARELVEKYAIKLNPVLHKEIKERYAHLDIAPYKGFINPWMKPVVDAEGKIIDVELDYTESFEHQNLRYRKPLSPLSPAGRVPR